MLPEDIRAELFPVEEVALEVLLCLLGGDEEDDEEVVGGVPEVLEETSDGEGVLLDSVELG